MSDASNTIVVFTARSPERILREHGSQSWVLDVRRAKACKYLICTQNQHNRDPDFEDANQPHGQGFLLGKISQLTRSREAGCEKRWHIGISEYAHIAVPDMWRGWRNPVRYAAIAELGIDPTRQDWLSVTKLEQVASRAEAPSVAVAPAPSVARYTIAEAKNALAASFGVSPDDIEITIRG